MEGKSMIEMKTKMMTDKVDPREVTESKYEDKIKKEMIANSFVKVFIDSDLDKKSYNPNKG